MPYGVARFLRDHDIEMSEDRGWARIVNGELIKTAEEAGFDLIVTANQNIVYQQNLKNRRVALIVLSSNIWPIVRDHDAQIMESVEATSIGSYAFIEMKVPPKSRK